MKLFMLITFLISALVFADDFKPKYGPLKKPIATPLYKHNDFFRKHPAKDFFSLISYYLPQENDYSCSVAVALTVLNASKVGERKSSDDKNIQVQDLLSKVMENNWKARVSPEGDSGKHGLNLEEFAENIQAAAKIFGVKTRKVQALRFEKNDLKKFEKILMENQENSNDFIVINFLQSALTDDAEVGHFATVGAYNKKAKEVLILDPDRLWYEPYWVSVDALFRAITLPDVSTLKPRGLIHIEIL